MPSDGDSPLSAHDQNVTNSSLRRPQRWVLDSFVVLTLFHFKVGLWVLNPSSAPQMMTGDYNTYIVGQNYMRGGSVLSLPIGETPGYIYPSGSWLALYDAMPIFAPVYRLAGVVYGTTPFQFVGLTLFIGYLGTFVMAKALLKKLWETLDENFVDDLLSFVTLTVGSSLLVLLPVFAFRTGHPTLMQQWIVLAAIYLGTFCQPHSVGWAAKWWLTMVAASAIQPYFVPMVFAVVVVPLIVHSRRERVGMTLPTAWISTALVSSAATLVAFGFVGSGAGALSGGYGLFSADLLSPVSNFGTSRFVRPIPGFALRRPEGFGYVGAGILLGLAISVADILIRWPAVSGRDRQYDGARVSARIGITFIPVLTLALFAAWPVIHFAGWEIADLSNTSLSMSFVGDLLRANGRFVWPLSWFLSVIVVLSLLLRSSKRRLGLLCLLLVIQFWDHGGGRRSAISVENHEAYEALFDAELASGPISSVVIEPPFVVNSCTYAEIDVDSLGPLWLVAATRNIPVNSGYPSRPSESFLDTICAGEVDAGPDTLSFIPREHPEAAKRSSAFAKCTEVGDFLACRAEQ